MSLSEIILSEQNIYNAIYALPSYISEVNLLDKKDRDLLAKLADKFDFYSDDAIAKTIDECRKRLENILNSKELFYISVYFKLKKCDENQKAVFRPLHTASLIDQICMAALLMPLMFEDTDGTRRLSELSQMLPHNFFGNIPSERVDSIFVNWADKYRQYTETVNNKCREYIKTREYAKEISFDLKDFFPSVNPALIFNFITRKLQSKYTEQEDYETLRRVVAKLLYFKIKKENLEGWEDVYYPNSKCQNSTDYYVNRGIAQGLPQSYFFGNLCMIEISRIMSSETKLKDSEAFFYVDDSVVFAKQVGDSGDSAKQADDFDQLIKNLNNRVKKELCDNNKYRDSMGKGIVPSDYMERQQKLEYNIEFHDKSKSTICNIEDSFKGLQSLFRIQRKVSMGGWMKGNIDEVDDHISLKKLEALEKVVDNQIKLARNAQSDKEQTGQANKTRLKWLYRYRKYFIYRKRKLQMMVEGEYTLPMRQSFEKRFHFEKLVNAKSEDERKKTIEEIFEVFEEEIFNHELTMISNSISHSDFAEFGKKVKAFERKLAETETEENAHKSAYLYYHRVINALSEPTTCADKYASLCQLIKRSSPYRNLEEVLRKLSKEQDISSTSFWKWLNILPQDTTENDKEGNMKLPHYTMFVFRNSNEFKRMILNCCFSMLSKVPVADNLILLRTDNRPIRYYDIRILTMLRNYRFDCERFFEFLRSLDIEDLNERMSIDLSVLEAIGIFRQRVQDPLNVDKLIQTHRIVKSLWHNGSKFLNAYTLHNQEHAVALIKNVIKQVNNIDYFNLKAIDYFLLFQACYLHDISMVIHPKVSSFNETNPDAENIISQWMYEIRRISQDISNTFEDNRFNNEKVFKLRKEIGRVLIKAFQEVFDFFENKVRSNHAADSASCIRTWQKSMLSFLTELEAEIIAKVSHSHMWDCTDVYAMKSRAKEELVSLKYMLILLRMADLLDLTNERIDYHILKQNREQMNLVSRFHWISHLITDDFKLDVDYDVKEVKDLSDHPITENIHIDIFLNTDIMANINIKEDERCQGKNPSLEMRNPNSAPKKSDNCTKIDSAETEERVNKDSVETEEPANKSANDESTDFKKDGGTRTDKNLRRCIEYRPDCKKEDGCKLCKNRTDDKHRDCPFLCVWMMKKHEWLLTEVAEMKKYLNTVNSDLIKTDFVVRFYLSNGRKLDSEFYDDIMQYLS